MNITLFEELEAKIKILARELKNAREGQGVNQGSSRMDSDKLKRIESRVESLIQLLDQFEGNTNG
ncbi:MAG: hypothetical protein ACE5D8_03975 [Fidelibacterota bacterium]